MTNLRNSVQLVGHLGKNPEIKTLEKGNKLARFSIATNESFNSKEGKAVDNTTWHNLVAWGTKAEFAEKHLAKGNEVVVQGRISNRSYKDKEGVTKYISEIIITEVYKVIRDNNSDSTN